MICNRSIILFKAGFIVFAFLLSACSGKFGGLVNSFSPSIRKHKLHFDDGLQGYYYQNRGADTNTILFIIGGSGNVSAIYTLAHYTRPLNQLDANVYMLQKRHVKHRETGLRKPSGAFLRDYYFDQMVSDQEFFIKTILDQIDHRDKKVLLLGVSEGATVASKVASEITGIDYLAILGSGGMQQSDELKILYPTKQADLERLFADIKLKPQSLDTFTMGYSYKYWSHILFLSPMPYLLSLKIPILVAIGDKDQSTPVASARYIDSIFAVTKKTNLTYIEYKNCGHTLKDDKGKSHLPHFFSKLRDFVRNN